MTDTELIIILMLAQMSLFWILLIYVLKLWRLAKRIVAAEEKANANNAKKGKDGNAYY